MEMSFGTGYKYHKHLINNQFEGLLSLEDNDLEMHSAYKVMPEGPLITDMNTFVSEILFIDLDNTLIIDRSC